MSNKIKYPVGQTNKEIFNSEINDKCVKNKQSPAALKAHYHNMTLAFVKDNSLDTLKYTELTQSLSSFLMYLLSSYKNDHENTNKRYRPLREAMKIYSTHYDFKILNFGINMILQKEPIDRNILSKITGYDKGVSDDENRVCVINYKDILQETTSVAKNVRDKCKNNNTVKNNTVNKKKLIEDLKKALSVPVTSDKATKMMLNMGWDGGSLGIRGDGITEPIMPELDLKAGAGLGHVNKAEVKNDEFIIDILEKFLEFLKSDVAITEVVCARKVTPKERGFITNTVHMVNVNRRVEVKDEKRGVLLNRIYEMSCLKRFHVTVSVVAKTRTIKFTKAQIVRQVGLPESKVKQVSVTSNARKVTLSSTTFNPSRGNVKSVTEALLKFINTNYVTPFTPLNINKQSLNNMTFRTTTLIYILDFNKSRLDQVEVVFGKVLNVKERGFVNEIVETINRGHNKKGAKTKVENHLLNEIWATGMTHYLVAGFGRCNISFTLEKVIDTSIANSKRVKMNSLRNRNEEANNNNNNDHLNEIFANIDETFPPLVWTDDNEPPFDDNDYSDTELFVENAKNITTKVKSNNKMTDNLIIVKDVNSNDRNSAKVRKIYLNSDTYVTNSNKSCESFKSNIENGITNPNSSKCQTFTATSIGNSDTQINIRNGIVNLRTSKFQSDSNLNTQSNITNGIINLKCGRPQTRTASNNGDSDAQSNIKNGIIESTPCGFQTFTATSNGNSDTHSNIRNGIINPNCNQYQISTAISKGSSGTPINIKNEIIKTNSDRFQTFITATGNGINDNKNKLVPKDIKLDYEKAAEEIDDDLLDIDLSVWTSCDEDSVIDDTLNEEISPKRNSRTTSRMESDVDESESLTKNDISKVESENKDVTIEERVKHMDIKEKNDDNELHRKKRSRTVSEDSDLMIFKKYKTVDRITHVNLTPKDSTETVDDDGFVRRVQTVISIMLDVTKELPLLKCHGYRNGALVYSCHDEKSLSWLQTNCVATGDIKITIVDEILVESVKMSLKINCYIDENYKKIFDRLENYNRGLSTKQWVWMKEEKFIGYIIITFKVDELSFDYIRNKNFRLFAGIDEAQFTVVWN